MSETTFSFIPRAARSEKPRKIGLTEIRGPYYSAYGPRHLADVLETMGAWVDGVKYAGGSFALMPPEAVKAINKVAHDHEVYVSSGGTDRERDALRARGGRPLYRRGEGARLRRD